MPGFNTPFQGYSVKFSPFEDGKVAVATSQNFGIIGNGRQYVLQVGSGCDFSEWGMLWDACMAGKGCARRSRALKSLVTRANILPMAMLPATVDPARAPGSPFL